MNSQYLPTETERKEYLAYKTKEDVVANLEYGMQSLKEYPFAQFAGKHTLVCGGMAAFDKGIFHFLNQWNDKNDDLFLLSEVTAQYRRYTEDKIHFPYICTPHLLAKEMILLYMPMDVVSDMQILYDNKLYIREAVKNLEARHIHLGEGYALVWSYYAHQYITLLLERLKPKEVVLWNEFYAFHHIFHNICEEKNIPVTYMEFGCIPGTFTLDKMGQQGESKVAMNECPKMARLSAQKKKDVSKILSFIRQSGLNRNEQPEVAFSTNMMKVYKRGRPIVTFMGQNDYESGLFPCTKNTRLYHSPIFQSSIEAAKFIQDICTKRGWNYIYKPHPIMKALGHIYPFEDENVTILDEVNINSLVEHSDVVVTILSQSAYVSLIHETPVVMLGYTQLRGKSCCYEAFVTNRIEKQMKKAIRRGITYQQKKQFLKHVEQMLEYNLYDDLVEREVRYGKMI